MLLEKYVFVEQNITIKKSLIYMILFGISWIVWQALWCESEYVLDIAIGSVFGVGVNPPGLTLMISALLMLFLCYGLFGWLENGNVIGNKIVDMANFIGRQSLYIFLFHRLILDYFLIKYVQFENRWMMRVIYFFFMIAGSIMIGEVVKLFIRFLKKSNLPIIN